MRWNTPLHETHAGLLLERLNLGPGLRIADLGCGWGELLARAVERADAASAGRSTADDGAGSGPDVADRAPASGVGVDLDDVALRRGRAQVARRGLTGRVEFVAGQAETWPGPADRALCIGAAHAFGGARKALRRLAEVVPAGGRALFGDGYWEREPSAAALDIFGADVLSLSGLLIAARDAGWRVLHVSTADQLEWDDFESTSRAGRQEWLLANESDPRAAEVRDWLDTREREYFEVYRGVLGLAYLVLAH